MLTLRRFVLPGEATTPTIRAPKLLSWAPTLLTALLLVSQPAYALNCGDTVTTNVKLTADLRPCPGNGLVVQGQNLTIDLNGHLIVGGPTGVGILFGLNTNHITIKGPGEIATFGTGIQVLSDTAYVLIYNVYLYENGVGMDLDKVTHLRVMNNTVDGGSGGTIGFRINELIDGDIYRNTIQRHNVAGVMTLEFLGGAVVSENTITANQVGIVSISEAATLRGNTISSNNTDGIQVFGPFIVPTIQDNQILSNGGNGISVAGGSQSGIIQDNIVRNNKGSGISITSGAGVTVTGSLTSGNGIDLFWDGTGTSCGALNVFGTSSSPSLPACP